ncbi:histone-lysine N-methyltransferase [Nakaseomyces glabratus]|nr:histone-lysine N-methyltransferase [Nakaseomyces glabratus]
MTNSSPVKERISNGIHHHSSDKFKVAKKRRGSSVSENANRSGIAAAVALAKAATVPFPLKRNSVSSSSSTSPPTEYTKTIANPITLSPIVISELIKPGEKTIKAPIKAPPNEFEDKYVKLFIDSHHDDDSVITIPEESKLKFLPIVLKPGMISFSKQYVNNAENKYDILGTPTRNILFHPHWPLYINTSGTKGAHNVLEHLRCSCNPNVELVTVRIMDNKPRIKFVIRAIRDIAEGEELQIAWQWDINHPMWHVVQELQEFDSLNNKDKCRVSRAAEALLQSNQCACTDFKKCKLRKVQQDSRNFINNLSALMKKELKNEMGG